MPPIPPDPLHKRVVGMGSTFPKIDGNGDRGEGGGGLKIFARKQGRSQNGGVAIFYSCFSGDSS